VKASGGPCPVCGASLPSWRLLPGGFRFCVCGSCGKKLLHLPGLRLEDLEDALEESEELLAAVSRLGEGVLILEDGAYEAKWEEWETVCLEHYAEQKGYSMEDADEEDWWDILGEAVAWAEEQDGWEGSAYAPPEVSGAAWGATLFWRKLKTSSPQAAETESVPA